MQPNRSRHYPPPADDASLPGDAAINDIKSASIDAGKDRNDRNDRSAIDGHVPSQSRFNKANELLYAAHQDLSRAEDVLQSRGLRNRALMHVDQAHNTVDQAVKIARWQ